MHIQEKKQKKILTDVLKFSIFLCHFADREAVAKIMAMSGSLAPPLPPEALRPQRQATFTFGSNRRNMYRTAPDPRGFYAQSWMPYYEDRNASEDRRVREMDRRLAVYEQHSFFFFKYSNCISKTRWCEWKDISRYEIVSCRTFFSWNVFFFSCRSDSLPQLPVLQRSNTFTDMRPMQRRTIRYPKSEEYVHDHSMFMVSSIYISNVHIHSLFFVWNYFNTYYTFPVWWSYFIYARKSGN